MARSMPFRARRGNSLPVPGLSSDHRFRWGHGRVLSYPRPGFYVMRLCRGAPLVAALIYRHCPMVIPEPGAALGPDPSEWCRPLDGPPRYGALIDGQSAAVERVWANRSLRRVSAAEYAFRIGPLRRWARANPAAPEARPDQPVDLAALPPLY